MALSLKSRPRFSTVIQSRRDLIKKLRCNRNTAILAIAKKNLKEFEAQTDEDFLIRADMRRKLRSL